MNPSKAHSNTSLASRTPTPRAWTTAVFRSITYYVRRSVIELPSGDLLATVYGQFKGDQFPVEYQAGMRKMRSYLIRSKDGGKNWDFV